jgi:hypothetical protein
MYGEKNNYVHELIQCMQILVKLFESLDDVLD